MANGGPSIRDLDEARRRREILGEGRNPDPAPEDHAWAIAHLTGYGQVDAPSPFGHDRDVFMAEHPGYKGGQEYNPATGRYDADEPPPKAWAEPQQGTSGPVPQSQDLSGLPLGGNAESAPVEMSFAQGQDMPGAAPQDAPPQMSMDGGLTLDQLVSMLDTFSENSQTSAGT